MALGLSIWKVPVSKLITPTRNIGSKGRWTIADNLNKRGIICPYPSNPQGQGKRKFISIYPAFLLVLFFLAKTLTK
ncbi:hypothetical protein COT68_02385 [bacterium (Candidatus Torokbacteria) CG09_land_8_20_14_0_10_42_11]|nr:MAG: hypothetical protein COT68_02385 [bacterium (Candidatus Torokbacteria) CG09_land_8_20_14_0_10_42_11]